MKRFGTTLFFFIREKLRGIFYSQKYNVKFIPARKLCVHAGKISCTKKHFFVQLAYMVACIDISVQAVIFPCRQSYIRAGREISVQVGIFPCW